jgi:hypothetical protein
MDRNTEDDDLIRALLDDPAKGSWEGDTFTPKLSALVGMDPMNLVTYFDAHGGKNRLHLP